MNNRIKLDKKINCKNKQFNNNLCEDVFQDYNNIAPICYTGMQNQTAIINFSDYFTFENIYKLINDVESIRQVGGYTDITVYFSSNGGCARDLFVLSDYLTGVRDINIKFVVSEAVCSCGFYILLMLDSPNIQIEFSKDAYGLIHLATISLESRGQLSSEVSKYNSEKFKKASVDELNKYFIDNFINKLDLSEEDKNKILDGQDVYISNSELERLVKDFYDRIYTESDDFIDDYANIIAEIDALQALKEQYENNYKKYTGESLNLLEEDDAE